VVLKLKPGATFNRAQANSVVQLVSRSVDGLKQENVTVVDSTGRLLSDPRAGEKDEMAGGLIDQRRELEQYLSQKAQAMLTAHLGPGRAVVQVSADLNYQKVKELQTTYPKDGTVPRAERTVTTKSASAPRGGIAGAGSNIRQAGGTSGGTGSSSEEVTQTDYDTSKMVREMEEKMGAVTRLTVAALVDLTPPPAVEGQPAPAPISPADAEAIIQNAIGFKTGRDSVKVVNGRLGEPPPAVGEPDEETTRIQRMAAYVELARNISLAVSVVMAMSALGLLLFRRRPKAANEGTGTTAAEGGPTAAATPEQRRQEQLDKFVETARTDPARAAAAFGLLLGPPGG
jgi:flagellar M-ring protein FliF